MLDEARVGTAMLTLQLRAAMQEAAQAEAAFGDRDTARDELRGRLAVLVGRRRSDLDTELAAERQAGERLVEAARQEAAVMVEASVLVAAHAHSAPDAVVVQTDVQPAAPTAVVGAGLNGRARGALLALQLRAALQEATEAERNETIAREALDNRRQQAQLIEQRRRELDEGITSARAEAAVLLAAARAEAARLIAASHIAVADTDIADIAAAVAVFADTDVADTEVAETEVADTEVADTEVAAPDFANIDFARLVVAGAVLAQPAVAEPVVAGPVVAETVVAEPVAPVVVPLNVVPLDLAPAVDVAPALPVQQLPVNVVIDAEAFARVFATVFASMFDERAAAWGPNVHTAPLYPTQMFSVGQFALPQPTPAPAPVKQSFWSHAKHVDVLLLSAAMVIVLVVLAAWLA